MEQNNHTEPKLSEEYFQDDLRALCRCFFGSKWTDQSAKKEGLIYHIGWLPKLFQTLYETIGGEQRMLKTGESGGFLPAEKLCIEPHGVRMYLAYYETGCGSFWGRFAFSHSEVQKYSGIFVWRSCINGWEQMYGVASRRTLCDILLGQAAEHLAAQMEHCVWIKVPLRTAGATTWYEKERMAYQNAAACLGLTPLKSISDCGHAYAYNIEQQFLMEFCADGQKHCLVYSQDARVLERLGEKYPVIWQKRDGEKVLDPRKFIQSPAPASFVEKLDMLSTVLLGKRSMALPLEEIEKAEQRLGMVFPDALKEFYLRFGKGGKLFDFDSLNYIYTPKELGTCTGREEGGGSAQNKDPVLVEENQAVWYLRLDRKTGDLYLEMDDGSRENWDLNLEDTLLWLLAMNATGFLPRGGECLLNGEYSWDDDAKNRELFGHFFHFFSEGRQAVFVNPERGLVGCRDEDILYIMAHQGKALEKLEEDADILVDDI